MELSTRVKLFLKANGIRANKKLGQHFLIDEEALKKLVDAAGIKPDETILEIGPGFGILTDELVKKARRVVAVEKDERMISLLRTYTGESANLEIIRDDVMEADLSHLLAYSVVANLPYYITSPVIRSFLTAAPKPERMVLTVQKEVAERITESPPGSVMAFSTQYYAVPELLFTIPRGAFLPPPAVESAVIRLTLRPKPYFLADEKKLFRIVKAAFGERRKQLTNSLAGGLKLEPERVRALLKEAKIEPTRRAETLTLDEWAELYGGISLVLPVTSG